MTKRSYGSPQAFKTAIEERIRTAEGGGANLARRRQILVFSRFLARVAAVFGEAVTLKGGLVLEMRIQRAPALGPRSSKTLSKASSPRPHAGWPSCSRQKTLDNF